MLTLFCSLPYVHGYNCVYFYPDDNGAVIIAVVIVIVVLILCCCIIMNILFCYCCRRKEQSDQNNGVYIRICMYACTRTYVCIYIYIPKQKQLGSKICVRAKKMSYVRI